MNLLKSHGFQVDDAKEVSLYYKLHKDFVDNFRCVSLNARLVPRPARRSLRVSHLEGGMKPASS